MLISSMNKAFKLYGGIVKKKVIITVLFLIGIILILSACYLHLKVPVLTMPEYITKECNVKKERFQNRNVYIVSPKENKKDLTIFYLHGGSYATNLTTTYWEFISDISKDTGATVIIPDYPLIPESYYKDVFKFITPLYEQVLEKVGTNKLILMGDSAGGGLSLALSQIEGKKGKEEPRKTILISPWLDISMENPEIDKIQPKDPLLKKDLLKLAGEIYARNTDTKNELVSPLYGSLDKLKNIVIFSGTNDILNPDVKLLIEKAKSNNIKIDYKETENAVHIWVVSHRDNSVYKAEEDYQKLVEVIKEE